MAAWSDGYFTDIQYTGRCYPELAPGFLTFACLRQGVRPPALAPGASYLELGCGQGYGLNLMAAANPGLSFWGVDFHPGQVANAQRLVQAAELSNVTFEDLSFEQLLGLPDGQLPRFDVIALHGIYSWVSIANRAVIVQLLDRLLHPGGMVYVSYNCLPGWAPLAPLQRFVAEHVARAPGDPQARIVEALGAARQMLQGDAAYFGGIPALRQRIEEALAENPAYLVHEYLNAHAHPLYHADVARELGGARLTFAASANIADDLVNLSAPAPLQPMIQAASDPIWKETLLDYASAKPFRRDIFVRGANRLRRVERDALLDATRFTLLTAPQAVSVEFPIPIGRLTGQPGVYRPIIEALSEGPRSYAELRALPSLAGAREGALLQAVTLLVGGRQIHPMPPPADSGAGLRFNRAVVARARFGEVARHLAAPTAGAAVGVDFADLMAVNGALQGLEETPGRAARLGWEVMAHTGHRLLRNGEVLQDQAGAEAELAERIAAFNRVKLPLFRALGVV